MREIAQGYRMTIAVLGAFAVLTLSACGGGGGGSGATPSGGGSTATYTVGGSVSGLTDSGLVLELNGQYKQSVAANESTYTFSTPLPQGASYQVTVAAQPAGETCTVASPSGTVQGNVTSASVTCTIQNFTVSGTVSGLSSSGLKLQDYSGGESLALAAGTTKYTFVQSLPYGTNVDVTVTAQPSWQICVASTSNFSGPVTSNVTAEDFTCTAVSADVSTLAGSTTQGSADGTGSAASFYGPSRLAINASGDIFVADSGNNEIREITQTGVVTTFAGSTSPGSADGTGAAASFDAPQGVALDSAGNLYVADTGNNEIRKITPAGVVTTFAGSTVAGNQNGTGTAASFATPYGIAVSSTGTIYVADTGNNEIREITSAGVVSTLAGSLSAGSADGTGATASFNRPVDIALDSAGNLYVADFGNNEIRKVSPSGAVTTLAGSTTAGSADGVGAAASFDSPSGVAVDANGNVYVADTNNNEIRLVSANGVVTTLAGSTIAGSANGTGTAASFKFPFGIVLDSAGDLYVGDYGNDEIRKIVP